ncbi:hypothetical protein ACIFQM_17465 [Paenibacillus sp. NRS-1782]|uniref:hypothetical protein n=1 Tax=unclassified Paenibacillus TaxID=185978 RepID=UPI003D2839DF
MPVQINITGEDANQAIKEFSVLSAAFTGVPASTVVPTSQEDKPKRNRTTAPKPEPKEDPSPDQVSKEVQEDGKKIDGLSDGEQDIPDVVELREAAAAVGSTPEAKAKIKALLDQYEARNLSAVSNAQKVEFLAALKALANE